MRVPVPIGRPIVAMIAISVLAAGCGSGAAAPGSVAPSAAPAGSQDVTAVPSRAGTPAAPASATADQAAPTTSLPTATALRVVAIGDSLAQASSCHGCVDYVDRFGVWLEESVGRPVTVDNRAAIQLSGLPPVQTGQLLNDLLTDPKLRASIASADVVIVDVGFNDTPWNRFDNPCDAVRDLAVTEVDWAKIDRTCIARVTNEYAQRLDQILSQINELRGCARPWDQPIDFCARVGRATTVIRVVSVYDDWTGEPGVPRAGVEATSRADLAMLTAQCWIAELHGGSCVDVFHLLNGRSGVEDAAAWLTDDHTHLGQAGHDRIAAGLEALGYDPIR